MTKVLLSYLVPTSSQRTAGVHIASTGSCCQGFVQSATPTAADDIPPALCTCSQCCQECVACGVKSCCVLSQLQLCKIIQRN